MRAYECHAPLTKKYGEGKLVKYDENLSVNITDPFRSKWIPVREQIFQWQTDLRKANLATGNWCIEFGGYQRYDFIL